MEPFLCSETAEVKLPQPTFEHFHQQLRNAKILMGIDDDSSSAESNSSDDSDELCMGNN